MYCEFIMFDDESIKWKGDITSDYTVTLITCQDIITRFVPLIYSR